MTRSRILQGMNQGAVSMACRAVGGIAVVLVLVGPVAWSADPAQSTTLSTLAQPSVTVDTAVETQMKERILARWQALIKRDFEATYLFETPAYRAIYTLRQFMGQQGNQVDWRMARVKEIHYDDPMVARVIVEITYRYAEPTENGQVRDLTQEVKETWLRKDGQWWHQRD